MKARPPGDNGLVEQKRFELSTPTLRTWCSSQLSYCPNTLRSTLLTILLVVGFASRHGIFFAVRRIFTPRPLVIGGSVWYNTCMPMWDPAIPSLVQSP